MESSNKAVKMESPFMVFVVNILQVKNFPATRKAPAAKKDYRRVLPSKRRPQF
jgi:hypothetical protein